MKGTVSLRVKRILVLAGLVMGLAGLGWLYLYAPRNTLDHLGENPALEGQPRALIMIAIFLGTFVSEDLACIGSGLLVATGRIDFLSATAAAFAGIFIGDIFIFAAGFFFGGPILSHRWARWVLSRRSLNRAEGLFRRKGLWIILATRFLPGTRTATYFTAGALRAPAIPFILVFGLAAAIWTPLLVGLSHLIGRHLIELYLVYEAFTLPALLAVGLGMYLIFHYGLPMFTWQGRRRLRGKWLRATRWEYWPVWQVNGLVLLYILYLGFIRHRRPTLFTAANPCMPHGGFIGENKSDILAPFSGQGRALPAWTSIPAGDPPGRMGAFTEAFARLGLHFPVVLKPDEGQRGLGVRIIRSVEEAENWFREWTSRAILQEFVAGNEYGLFYVRYPSEEEGRLISITRKKQMEVTGNGTDRLETLIHGHPRAIAQLDLFLERFAPDLERVLGKGERLPLGEIGTHALGAVFLDGSHLLTPELSRAVDTIAKACPGFHFGRFDFKAPDDAALKEGRGLRIIEVNGVTSEATHIYDPRHGLFHAWRTLCGQWRIAFEIGRENADRGAAVSKPGRFFKDAVGAWLRQKQIQQS